MTSTVVREQFRPFRAGRSTIQPYSNISSSFLLVVVSPRSTLKPQVMQITEGKGFSEL
jgi:hypothetical protein